MKPVLNAHEWWSRLRHQGLLLSPAVMVDRFGAPDPVDERYVDFLRQSHDRFRASSRAAKNGELAITEKNVLRFLDDLLEGFLRYPTANVRKQGQIPESVIATFQIGSRREPIRPDRVIDLGEATLLIMVDTNPHLGRGRGRTTYARLLELLRGTGKRLGLLTNGLQVRLVYAGMDTESWCEWEVSRWFDRGEGEEELAGLRQLLCSDTLNPPLPDDPKKKRLSSLLEAIEESRKRQAELSGVLGEAVRRAVEHLTDELSMEGRRESNLLETLFVGPDGRRLTDAEAHDALMQAAVRVVMRLVVCLFAESRGLLPVNDLVYANSYGVRSLFDSLESERQREGGEARLFEYHSAWLRLIALFRLVHDGSRHASFPMPRYGGLLFRPGQEADPDPVLRALHILEHKIPVSDATVHALLRKLLRGKLPIIVGRVRREVEGPMDYTYLRTEFIGIIYEGVLDYKLKRASDSAQVFLNIGREPVLPLERLEGMLTADPKGLKDLLTKLSKEKATGKSEGEDEEVEEIEEEEAPEPVVSDTDLFTPEETPEGKTEEESVVVVTQHADADQRARAWAREAVRVAGLAPKKRKGESDYVYDKRVDEVAHGLISRVVGDGEFYLVRAGNVRKGSGTFYTKPQLAVPTVHRTLEPLCYNADKTPKTPTEILNLKVCDPACGSASFLVAALHYLSDALYNALVYHCGLEDPARCMKIALPFGTARTGALEEETVPFSPDDPKEGDQFPERIKAILRRHVVERCIYGVDINPLAVELARVSLWVDTMHRTLPFGFLDHKIKVGNALVGCWLDRVLDYPIAAWQREGGDGKDGERTTRIDKFLKGEKSGGRRDGDGIIKKEMRSLIDNNFLDTFPVFPNEQTVPTDVVAEAKQQYEALHSDIRNVDEQEREYKRFTESVHYRALKQAMDEWCAVWFWPMDTESVVHVPTPKSFHAAVGAEGVAPARGQIIERLFQSLKFFHWELEFPDAFTPERSGFDAVLGNPPWEVMKANSHEFFTDFDPLYRTYDKQDAIRQQGTLFKNVPNCANQWLNYVASFKAMSNWVASACTFYDVGLAKGGFAKGYREVWLSTITSRKGYAELPHPFFYQGSADLNSYKMFLEVAHTLLSPKGRLGMIVPSGIYTDSGTEDLRTLFLDQCTWNWLFSFENRKRIFDIHGSFKFAAVIVDRRKTDATLKAAFMIHDTDLWERNDPPVFEFDRGLIQLFSPRSKSLPEVRTARDLQTAHKIYDHSFRIGDSRPGWEIAYAREFDMTNDSKLFLSREKCEAQGYKSDIFGRWSGPKGDTALPLYEGRMIGQFDFSEKGWVSGKGRSAVWRDIPFADKCVQPQYLMSAAEYPGHGTIARKVKIYQMRIGASTNARTLIACALSGIGAGDTAASIEFVEGGIAKALIAAACMSSLSCDYITRQRVGGLHIDYFLLAELPLPRVMDIDMKVTPSELQLVLSTACLTFVHRSFAPEWLRLKQEFPDLEKKEWKHWWAVTEADRLRLRVEIDALCADLYGLDPDDFDWIVRNDPSDPKGFWRVDKQLPYEERLTGLAANAFRKLKDGKWSADTAGDLSNDEFFEILGIPELTNERAAKAKGLNQPLIMKRTGCHSWRPELFPESDPRHGWTWEHCKQDAIALLGSEEALEKYLAGDATPPPPRTLPDGTPVGLLGNPIPTNLFGEEVTRHKRNKR